MGLLPLGDGEQKFDDAIRIGVGERLEQNRVDHGEDGCVGSDAEGQGGDGGDSEAGVLDEHVQRMLDVTPEIGHGVAPFTGRMPRILYAKEDPFVRPFFAKARADNFPLSGDWQTEIIQYEALAWVRPMRHGALAPGRREIP